MHQVVSTRGGHAHMDTDQLAVSVVGDFEMEVGDGKSSATYRMNDPARGLYVPRMIFIRIHGMSPATVCLVLASTYYDMSRSIRSWEDYLQTRGLEAV